jgi:hypothetical protein
VGADPFGDSRRPGCGSHGFLQAAFVNVVAAHDAAVRIYRKAIGRKDALPDPLSLRVGVFALQGVGQVDGAISFCQVLFVRPFDNPQMVLKRHGDAFRKHRHPVLLPLAIADDDLTLGKVQALCWTPSTASLTRRRRHSIGRKPLPWRSLAIRRCVPDK